MFLFNRNECVDICLKNKNKYVAVAVNDLICDFERVSELSVRPKIVNEVTGNCIVIEENTSVTADPITDERFTITVKNGKIVISAGGYLGTMWGIYTISEKYLGVNPCYLFNDLAIEKKPCAEIPEGEINSEPQGYGFRGVFINDEDLLTGWKEPGGLRYIDCPFYNVTVPVNVMEKVVETMVRLKFNLIIPATFLDVDNPPEKALADCVARRGIYLSQHHCEPMGVTSFTFKNYCDKFGKKGNYSYTESPELLEEVWAYYADKWSKYDNVVWQIGLRGLGDDRPVWQDDDPTEEQLISGAQSISRAYEKQREIIRSATGGRAKYFTSTLWMEGSTLVEKGYLKFPPDVIAVFADTSPTQLYGEEYNKVKREKGSKYGIYYHLQYYGCGPHLVPQTGLKKLYYNLKLAYDKGDNSYIIMNASNVREFVFELEAYSQMAWNMPTYSNAVYLSEYCDMYGELKTQMASAITEYFDSFPEIAPEYLKYHLSKYFNYDMRKPPEGITNFVLKEGSIITYGRQLAYNFYMDKFANEADEPLIKAYYEGIKAALPASDKVCRKFKKIVAEIKDENLKRHAKIKWLLSAETLNLIYRWYIAVYEAKLAYRSKNDIKVLENAHIAYDSLVKILKKRKCAEYGEFVNWYRGDTKMNIGELLGYTERLLCWYYRTPLFY